MKKLLPLFILILVGSVFGQKSVIDLNPAHANALKEFLSANKNYQTLSEKGLEIGYLKALEEYFGIPPVNPHYQVEDFNHDKIIDFAMILSRKGEPQEKKETTFEPHKYVYPLAVVIFNGNKNGTFRKAFIEDIDAPLACLLKVFGTKKKKIYFSVFESSADTRFFTPSGKGYVIDYPPDI